MLFKKLENLDYLTLGFLVSEALKELRELKTKLANKKTLEFIPKKYGGKGTH